MWEYRYTDELYHWGIKGMKWGVRRYQNKDGTRTSLGKRQRKQIELSDDAKEAAKIKKKNVGEMSNAELKKLNERQNLERQYKQANPSTIGKGMKAAANVVAVTTTAINLYNNSDKIIKIGREAAKLAGKMII